MNGLAPSPRTALRKLALVLAGYITAFLLTCAVFYVRSFFMPDDASQASAGMQAFGDLMLFLGMFGTLSLVPTGLALFFLRKSRGFWILLSILSLIFAATGPVAALSVQYNSAIIGFLGIPRILGAPLFCLAFLISAIITPSRGPRWTLLVSAFLEAATSGYAFLCLVVLGHWLA
ncbi:MAG TPA: hypothetical protein VMV72_01715 [Verrucomicrobiae bacterium]|nr:hypothetical protein [Verrucomicrobiae bacterium]